MIRWAIDHQHLDPDRTILHFGALLATFPFAGVVAAIAGRQLHLECEIEPLRVRAEAKTTLGDRSTVDIGARKVLTTMRYLGLLEGANGGPFLLGCQPIVPATLAPWITHALLLTRQTSAIDIDASPRAFELSTVKLGPASAGGYPFLELHAEGTRTVAVPCHGT